MLRFRISKTDSNVVTIIRLKAQQTVDQLIFNATFSVYVAVDRAEFRGQKLLGGGGIS